LLPETPKSENSNSFLVNDVASLIGKNKIEVIKNLKEIARKYNTNYDTLLLTIWFNMPNVITEGTRQVTATDTRSYQPIYNKFGELIADELTKILKGSSWNYFGASVYDADPKRRHGSSTLTITTNNKRYIITSNYVFDPQITIAGAITSGDNLQSVYQLPDPLGPVDIKEMSIWTGPYSGEPPKAIPIPIKFDEPVFSYF
jgi:aryl-phospho-beta-D-glucosidase BglC (GH1 family)